MAEAVCGPSNALQQFKQQTDVDQTLQQDRLRLASRQHPAHAFRSPNPHAGALDPEFEAFQAGHGFPLQDNALRFQRPAGLAASAHAQAPSWAADFQRMQISSPPPMQQQHFQPAPSSADWAQDFRAHVAQAAPRAQDSSPSPQAFQQRARYALNGFQSQISQSFQPNYAPAVQSKGKEPVTEQFDEAAFAAAFDQARHDMMAETVEAGAHNVAQEQEATAQELINEVNAEKFEALVEQAATEMLREPGHDLYMEEYTPLNMAHSGTDIEHEPMQAPEQEEQQGQKQAHDDDALAATAEELLEKVKHNQSDKFKNSQFLGLMRKLRDREVRVEGDKMVETERSSSTDTTLNASSTITSPSERVYYGKPQPTPLPLDTRPPDYGIPYGEQDHDMGRIDPRDGQEVVDLLNERGPITDDIGNTKQLHPRNALWATRVLVKANNTLRRRMRIHAEQCCQHTTRPLPNPTRAPHRAGLRSNIVSCTDAEFLMTSPFYQP
ncbi:hypothetical protein AC579_4897 [Pseudocercospora musae]|uniref:Peroxin 20 n=1 Tax=Pseudocercospora musae TaxID=113226 RepID=A0A139I4C2_9PEZI|nr:hypothetical protein AC579_4897 [Pseudocercospora musae]